MRTVLGVALAGLRHRPVPWLLLALGVAVTLVLPVLAAGLRAEAGTAAVRTAVDDLPAGSRSVLAVTSQDLRTRSWPSVDGTVRRAYADVGVTDVQQVVTFGPLAVSGQDVTLGALDRLGPAVRLRTGRLPRDCRPRACEVLEVVQGGAAAPRLSAAVLRSLGLRVTGVAELHDERFTGSELVSPELPLLLGSDPTRVARLASLTLFTRNTSWLGTLGGAAVAERGGPETTRRLAGLAADVSAAAAPLVVRWPAAEVGAASARASASADGFAVLGAGTACLQIGFGVSVAAGLRRRQVLLARLLARRGAGPAQVTAVVAVQVTTAVAAGAAVGVLTGAAVLLSRSGAPGEIGSVVGSVLPVLVGAVAAAVLSAVLVLRWSGTGPAAQWLLTTLLVGGAAASALLVRTGVGPATSVVAVPALLVSTGLLAARLWTPATSVVAAVVERRQRGRTVAAAVAVRVAHRRPLLPMVVAGVLAAACATTVFAVGYRGTLQRSAADQAAAQAPLDVAVTPSARAAAPLTVLDPAAVEAAVPGAVVHPVVSAPVTALAGTPLATSLPLTGIDASTLTAMHAFGATTGADVGAAELAARLSGAGANPTRARLPVGAEAVTARVEGLGVDVRLDLWLAGPYGGERAVRLRPGTTGVVRAVLPAGTWTVAAVEVSESPAFAMHRQHGIGEGDTDRAPAAGTLRLGAVEVWSADGSSVPGWSWAGWSSDQADVTAGAGAAPALRVRYRIDDRRVVLTPAPYDASTERPLPVAVDPDTAARADRAGRLTLAANGRSVPARVVAVLPRFPRVAPEFVLADRTAVSALLDGGAPGTAAVTQLWIGVPAASLPRLRTVLGAPPAVEASLTWRADVQHAVATDPVATRSVLLLLVAGTVALVLGLVALGAAVRADADDTAADAYALELAGLPPAHLRRVLAVRAGLVAAVGVPVGVLGGWLAGRVAVRLLVVGPGGAAVVPPLHYVLPAPSAVVVVGGVLAGTALVTAAVVAAAYRSPRPEPPELDLR